MTDVRVLLRNNDGSYDWVDQAGKTVVTTDLSKLAWFQRVLASAKERNND